MQPRKLPQPNVMLHQLQAPKKWWEKAILDGSRYGEGLEDHLSMDIKAHFFSYSNNIDLKEKEDIDVPVEVVTPVGRWQTIWYHKKMNSMNWMSKGSIISEIIAKALILIDSCD